MKTKQCEGRGYSTGKRRDGQLKGFQVDVPDGTEFLLTGIEGETCYGSVMLDDKLVHLDLWVEDVPGIGA